MNGNKNKTKRKDKRVVVISDLHCGHVVGLTPPSWQFAVEEDSNESIIRRNRFSEIQKMGWDYYYEKINELKPIDILLVNGDCVDGKGPKSGSTELITADRNEQAEMAAYAILEAEANNIIMTYGTSYHTGASEDWEDLVAEKVNATKISSHEWIEVNGIIFDMKHFVSKSSVPHGRGTPLARAALWNIIWADQDRQEKSDIIVRSHVHYAYHCGEPRSYFGLITPALQGLGSKYGTRRCENTVDFGFVSFNIKENGTWKISWHILKSDADKPIVTSL